MSAERRAEIIRLALELLDEQGLDAVSLRAVARRLGVRLNTVAWYLKTKARLHDLMADAIIAEIPLDALPASWDDATRELLRRYRRALLGHRDGGRVVSGTFAAEPATLRYADGLTSTLLAGGLNDQAVSWTASTLVYFTQGLVQEEQTTPAGLADQINPTIDARTHPALLRTLPHLTDLTFDNRFEYGLNLILTPSSADPSSRPAAITGSSANPAGALRSSGCNAYEPDRNQPPAHTGPLLGYSSPTAGVCTPTPAIDPEDPSSPSERPPGARGLNEGDPMATPAVTVRRSGPKSSLGENARETLLRVAARCFERHGIAGTSMERIAREAGVSRPTVHYYFSSKDSLVEAFIAREVAAILDQIRRATEHMTGVDRVVEAVALGIHASIDNQYLRTLIAADNASTATRLRECDSVISLERGFWTPLLDQARTADHALRGDLSDDHAIDWIVFVQFAITNHGHAFGMTDEHAIRTRLRDFLLPALEEPPRPRPGPTATLTAGDNAARELGGRAEPFTEPAGHPQHAGMRRNRPASPANSTRSTHIRRPGA